MFYEFIFEVLRISMNRERNSIYVPQTSLKCVHHCCHYFRKNNHIIFPIQFSYSIIFMYIYI